MSDKSINLLDKGPNNNINNHVYYDESWPDTAFIWCVERSRYVEIIMKDCKV